MHDPGRPPKYDWVIDALMIVFMCAMCVWFYLAWSTL